MRELRGLKALVHDAVDATTDLVGEGHAATARTTLRVLGVVPGLSVPARAVDLVRAGITGAVLGSVKGVNRAVEAATDLGLDLLPLPDAGLPPVPLRADAMGRPAWVADALLGAVNGVVGDHLHARGNALDLGTTLRILPPQGPRIAVFVHGLAATEWSWWLPAGDAALAFPEQLREDLGFTPVMVRYNTGRPLVDNGNDLAMRLQGLVEAWPVPVQEIVLVGHSMGGLVARAATLSAASADLPWLACTRRVVCLGSPHQGAPLERLGRVATRALAAVDLPATRIPARILGARSAGIRDLHDGELGEAVPLLPGLHHAFLAGTVGPDPAHPVAEVLGDGIVPVPSAEGPRADSAARVTRARVAGVPHHALQVHPAVYAWLRAVCAGEGEPRQLPAA